MIPVRELEKSSDVRLGIFCLKYSVRAIVHFKILESDINYFVTVKSANRKFIFWTQNTNRQTGKANMVMDVKPRCVCGGGGGVL